MALEQLLSANQEFGDNDNIFGSKPPTSNIVDFNKYSNIPDTVQVDYSKLTQISDTDQYNVVSIQDKHIIDDGYGNIKQSQNKTINDATVHNKVISFKPMSKLIQTGEMAGIIIKSQFGLNMDNNIPILKIQILNKNISGLPISQIKIKFEKKK
eukprot:267009_1